MKIKKTESGQVIMMLAVGFISLLAFAGLAIDGGRYYAEKRAIQNVADTTAFTGAKRLSIYTAANIDSAKMDEAEEVALTRAVYNGYDDDAADVSVTVDVTKEASPSPYYLITVEITSEIEPTFIKIVRDAPLPVSARAVARVLPKIDLGYGYSMFSSGDPPCTAKPFTITGSTEVDIVGNGIFSNSTCDCSIIFDGAISANISEEVEAAGGVCIGNNVDVTYGSIQEDLPQLPIPIVEPPDCGSSWPAPYQYWVGDELHFLPGNYNTWIINGGHYVLDDGLFCLHGRLKINGGIVEGDHVMLYLPSGEVKVTGGLVNLSPGEDGEVVDASGTIWDGMLIFMDENNDQTLDVNSIDIGSTWEGTVYAPGEPFNLNLPKCSYSGNGDTVGIDLQFVCYSIELIGNSNLFIDFDNNNTYEPPIYLNLVE